ncbi:hypothetical protein KEM48_013147 [Puccinia striiformis f. sp. tritici PST-130]|nr:hypothetical protein KEM48_013147 [Puccinia striiformis f. sp. tritici PST-130]
MANYRAQSVISYSESEKKTPNPDLKTKPGIEAKEEEEEEALVGKSSSHPRTDWSTRYSHQNEPPICMIITWSSASDYDETMTP